MTPFVGWKFSNFSLMGVDASWVDHEVDGRDLLWVFALGSDPRRFDKGKGSGFHFDPNRGQGVIQVDLQAGLDPLAGMISGTSDLTSTAPWSQVGVVRGGNEFRAGALGDGKRFFRVRLDHGQFSRLAGRPF